MPMSYDPRTREEKLEAMAQETHGNSFGRLPPEMQSALVAKYSRAANPTPVKPEYTYDPYREEQARLEREKNERLKKMMGG